MLRRDVLKALQQIGLRPQRAAGQHFLIDPQVIRRMVAAADITSADHVLEVGPGLGILTKALVGTGAEVTGVELDRRLAAFVRSGFLKFKSFQLIESDIFQVRLDQLFQDGQYKVVANLPYSATSLLLRNFFTMAPRPSTVTVMIQKEVARRMVAPPGQMSLLGLMTQYYTDTRVLFDVPRTSFYPAPEVTSSVIHAVIRRPPDQVEADKIFRLARAAFSGRRKQLHNTLATVLHQPTKKIQTQLTDLGISPHIRPQELTVENWQTLAKNLF